MQATTNQGLPTETLLITQEEKAEVASRAPARGCGGALPPPSLDTPGKSGHLALSENLEKAGYHQKAGDLRACGHQYVHRTCKECGDVVVTPWRCDLRICPTCARERANHLLQAHRGICGHSDLKHLVLTVPNVPHLTKQVIKDLRKSLKKLLHQRVFKSAWPGGVYAIEVTFSQDTRWHVHIHLLIEGRFIPQSYIRRIWGKITGGDRMVHIKSCNNPTEILKYICKPTSDLDNDPEALRELIEATQGIHMVSGWGWGYKIRSLDKPEPRACPKCGCRHFAFEIVPTLNDRVRGPP